MPKLEKSEPNVDARIGEMIRLRRIEIGLSQADLAEKIGMSFQQVQKYERGSNRLASSILIKVAKALQCSAGQLLGEVVSSDDQLWVQQLLADRPVAQLMERYYALKPAAARRRILVVLRAMMEEETEKSPTLAAKSPPKPKAPPATRRPAVKQPQVIKKVVSAAGKPATKTAKGKERSSAKQSGDKRLQAKRR